MSMIDTGIGADGTDPGERAGIGAEPPLPRFEASIVPKATIAGHALIAVIAIMTFLASLTIGAVMLLRAAAGDWQADLAREVTIQVRPVTGRDIEADIAKAAAIAGAASGIASVRPYSKEESTQLLQPWHVHVAPICRQDVVDRRASCLTRHSAVLYITSLGCPLLYHE